MSKPVETKPQAGADVPSLSSFFSAAEALVSGVIVSPIVSRLRFFGNTPNAVRNIPEDLGLVVFVAIACSHSGPTREAAKEIDSSMPWIGFPVGYAVSGVLLTVFGYLAMVMSK